MDVNRFGITIKCIEIDQKYIDLSKELLENLNNVE